MAGEEGSLLITTQLCASFLYVSFAMHTGCRTVRSQHWMIHFLYASIVTETNQRFPLPGRNSISKTFECVSAPPK
ncbi:hypothetical protein BDR06DRAFT_183684 [Suillus hirtellus]|nr:hypothetical protein BDR06DRAFT_183684 [Suillus hirtellus]